MKRGEGGGGGGGGAFHGILIHAYTGMLFILAGLQLPGKL